MKHKKGIDAVSAVNPFFTVNRIYGRKVFERLAAFREFLFTGNRLYSVNEKQGKLIHFLYNIVIAVPAGPVR